VPDSLLHSIRKQESTEWLTDLPSFLIAKHEFLPGHVIPAGHASTRWDRLQHMSAAPAPMAVTLSLLSHIAADNEAERKYAANLMRALSRQHLAVAESVLANRQGLEAVGSLTKSCLTVAECLGWADMYGNLGSSYKSEECIQLSQAFGLELKSDSEARRLWSAARTTGRTQGFLHMIGAYRKRTPESRTAQL